MSQPEPIPFVPEIEQNVLGTLFDGQGLQRVRSFLKASHFLDPLHAQIYDTATLALDRHGSSALAVVNRLLSDKLRAAIEKRDGRPAASVLASMLTGTPYTVAGIERAAQNVIDQWARIGMLDVMEGAALALRDVAADPSEVARLVRQRHGTGFVMLAANDNATRASWYLVVAAFRDGSLFPGPCRIGLGRDCTDVLSRLQSVRRPPLAIVARFPITDRALAFGLREGFRSVMASRALGSDWFDLDPAAGVDAMRRNVEAMIEAQFASLPNADRDILREVLGVNAALAGAAQASDHHGRTGDAASHSDPSATIRSLGRCLHARMGAGSHPPRLLPQGLHLVSR